MSLINIGKAPRRLHRLSQILQAFMRHGFGHLVYNLKLHTYLPVANRFREKPLKLAQYEEETLAKRLALVFQELGPMFVKLGQVLSTRPDLVPDEFVKEFRKLQAGVLPFDSTVAKGIVESELKCPIREAFLTFEDKPRASGSIAQVHDAILLDGTKVVVKVKRPGIDRLMLTDLDLLSFLADRAERIEELKPFRPAMLVEEFSRAIHHELDFITEASHTSKFHQGFESNPKVHIPKVYWDFTTSSVLTLERLSYSNLVDCSFLDEMGIDRKKLAVDLMTMFMEQFFITGMFHADPHPGNLLVSKDGTLGIIDFGMVGYTTEDLKNQLSASLMALIKKDIDFFVEVFIDIGCISQDGNIPKLKGSLLEILDKYFGIPLKRIDIRRAFSDVMQVARNNSMLLPRDFVLLGKSFITVTSMARVLDPDFDFASIVTPFTKGLAMEKLSPGHLAKTATVNTWHFANLVRQAPREIRYLAQKLLTGTMQIALKHQGLDNFIFELDRASNRLALSIILAATVIASSLVMMAGIGPTILGNISVLGIAGYSFATIMGLWLALGIFRSGRL
ncbi:MAG: phosphotransferase, partial [Planctomycetes bacterium]|nr:phosphotransferase [Planctomycetota bacterium]